MERIFDRDDVLFINDSKATNAEAAAPALAAFERVRWILGGQAKGDTLGDTAKHLDHVRSAYTIGEAGARFARLLGAAGVAAAECRTLEVAVKAAAPALAAFPNVRWILCGQAKGNTLGDTAKHLGHVRSAYTIGEAGAMFARLLGEAGVAAAECGTLEVAVKAAAHDAEPGDTVLLSPACASFDQFRDFEARGDAFRELVRAL